MKNIMQVTLLTSSFLSFQGPLYLMQGLKIQTNGDRLNGVKTPCEKMKQQEQEQERPRKIEINQGAVDDSTINTIVSTLKVIIQC